jgi:hypothetical protein
MEEDPGTNVRIIATADDTGVPLVWRILHEQSLYPCHIHRVQAFSHPDHRAKVAYCQWLIAQCVINTQFVANILFTEEAGFTMDFTVNFHNIHIRVDDIPHSTVTPRCQHIFPINVNNLDQLSHLTDLTGTMYHHFLVNDLPALLEHLHLHQQHMCFMHAGASPHFLRSVRQHLNQSFGEQWIEYRGPVNWPA